MAEDTGKNKKKLKIGILTFHNADNYGAVLQCYALQEALKKNFPDCDVSVVDYRNSEIEKSYRIIQCRKTILGNFTQFLYFPKTFKKRHNFVDFRKKYLCTDSSCLNDYDVIFYGSDQIWNFDITGGDLVYFGNNFNGIKIAYGASDGGKIKGAEENLKNLLDNFNSISCREKSLSEKISRVLNQEIPTVCDPVFLLSKDEWLKIAKKPRERNYILAYKVSENLDFDDEVEKTASRLGKKVVQIVYIKSLRKMFYKKQHFAEGISVERFLGYIANADLVITTSFHGTAFSVIFERPFYVLKLQNRAGRITDLLETLSLSERYVERILENNNSLYTKNSTELYEQIIQLKQTGKEQILKTKAVLDSLFPKDKMGGGISNGFNYGLQHTSIYKECA